MGILADVCGLITDNSGTDKDDGGIVRAALGMFAIANFWLCGCFQICAAAFRSVAATHKNLLTYDSINVQP